MDEENVEVETPAEAPVADVVTEAEAEAEEAVANEAAADEAEANEAAAPVASEIL